MARSQLLLTLLALACGHALALHSWVHHPEGHVDSHFSHHRALAARAYSRHMLQQASTNSSIPTTCTFTNATEGIRTSSCGPNREFLVWLLNNTDYVNTVSPFAARDIRNAVGPRACAAYNISTTAGRDACVADVTNACFLLLSGSAQTLRCASAVPITTAPGLFSCPGSIAYDRDVCQASNRTTCQTNPKCTWNLLGGGPAAALLTPAAVAQYQARWENQTEGAYSIDWGFCQYRQEWDIGTTLPNGTRSANYDWSRRYGWQTRTIASTNRTVFTEYNGNCSNANVAFTASEYGSRCSASNTMPLSDVADFGVVMMRNDRLPNITNMQRCIENQCGLYLYYTANLGPNLRAYINATEYYGCSASNGSINELIYDEEIDGPVYYNQVYCQSFDVQFDREACLAVPNGLSR